nr:SDR family NAD(P)-dependent oxidoreductase [Desulfobacterales bacterium]
MLEDELDLEADLGIDTVKQVEIFGKVSAHFGLDVPEDLKLNDLNTIAKIGDYLSGRVQAAPTGETQTASVAVAEETPSATVDPADSPVKRMVVKAVPTEASAGRDGWLRNRRVLITADQHGFTNLMAARIKNDGGEPVVIGDTPDAEITCDWSSPAAVKASVKEIQQRYAGIDGLLHFLPLDGALAGQSLTQAAIDRRLKHFFILIQGLYDELNRPGTFIALPAFNAAVLPFVDSAGGPIDPVSAGLAGLLKTVRKEMPETLVKIVDFEPQATAHPDDVIDTFTRELTSGERRVECGYRTGQRWVLQLQPGKPAQTGDLVQEDDTVLVTGGARGITFEILKTLAHAIPVRLEILGRSDVNGLDPALAGSDVSQADIMARLKAEMQGAKPLEIRRAVDRIVKLRESAANLETLRSLGARVTYHAVDVTDAAAVRQIMATTEGIDVLLHAAGIEESQMIPKKTMASFDRVFDTKVQGLINLLAALEHKAPRSLMTFSSVTARFGNEGQVDYTAANDMIAKMLLDFRRQHPQTAVKIFDWTAWEGAGMATNETVNKVLRERGLTFLPLADGVAHFMNELGDDTSPEVVFSGFDQAFDPDGLMAPEAPTSSVVAPLLDRLVGEEKGLRTYQRVLDLQRDLFLLDHSREDIPIFLGATGIEAMAEAAATLAAPGHVLRELQDFAIPYGIKILKQRPKEIAIEAISGSPGADTFRCRITSQFRNKKGIAMGAPKLHYHGSYTFGPAETAPPVISLPEFHPVNYDGDIQALLYHPARLFMDGLFRTVEDILSFEADRLISRIRFSSDRPFMADDPRPAFVTDVAIVDAMFQTGGMLEVMTTNIIVLPYTIRRMHFHRPVAPQREYLCITQRIASGPETNTYRLQLVDPDGNCYITIEDFEMVQVDQLSAEYQIVDQLNIGVQRRRAS